MNAFFFTVAVLNVVQMMFQTLGYLFSVFASVITIIMVATLVIVNLSKGKRDYIYKVSLVTFCAAETNE